MAAKLASSSPATHPVLDVQNGRCTLRGPVVRGTVPELSAQWQRVRPGEPVDVIDLAAIDQLDSAGMAFLLTLGGGAAIRTIGLPERFRPLAELYRLEAVLYPPDPHDSTAPGSTPEPGTMPDDPPPDA